MFKLEINLDNAAFDGDDCREEVARILRALAHQLADGSEQTGGVYDVNGNRCGAWRLSA